MAAQKLTVIFILLLFGRLLSGQCPDKSFLYKRIVYLRDSSTISPKDQLAELIIFFKQISVCKDKNDSTNCLLLARIGWLFSTQKDFVTAIGFTRTSIGIINANFLNPSINQSYLIKYYNNLRIFYDSLKQSKKSKEAIDSCILVSISLKKGYEYSLPLLYWRCQNLFEAGDYYSCITYANAGIEITRESGYQFDDIFYFLSWKINALILTGNENDAEKLAEKTILECKQRRVSKYFGILYSLCARIDQQQANYSRFLERSRKSFYFDLNAKNFTNCATILNNIGFNLYFQKLHRYDSATYYYKLALKYADKNESINILDNIANAYVAQRKFDSADIYFQKAYDQIDPGINENNLLRYFKNEGYKQIKIEYVIGLMLDKAFADLFAFKSKTGAKTMQQILYSYKVADKVMDRIKLNQTEQASKLFWQSSARRLYELAIDACFLSQNKEDAFYFFEKSRAVLLNDQLKEQRQFAESDILQLAQTRKKVILTEKNYNAKVADINQSGNLDQELFLSRQELNKLYQTIKAKNPLYYQSFIDTSFITINDVNNALLTDHQGLLEFYHGDSSVFTLLITKSDIVLNKIPVVIFDSLLKKYSYYLADNIKLNTHFEDYLQTSAGLFKLIFRNFKFPAGRIIVSPDGQYFPFESLVMDGGSKPVKYFLNNYAVSYTYSARFLLNSFFSNSDVKPKSFIGVAPVNYPPSFNLAPLPESDISLYAISSHFVNTTNLVLSTATKGNFMEQFYKYNIIQLYTHASDSSMNNEPVIWFADSSLYLSELISENRTITKLIVLSACNTGRGKVYEGEGVFSFNRGFAALGIPSSVTNLWSIDNVSTYKLTELFYKYLSQNLPLDIALQKAKLEFINSAEGENQLPYYWAASVLVGKTDPITIVKPFAWKYLFAGLGLAAIVFFTWKKWIKRKSPTPTRGTTQTAP